MASITLFSTLTVARAASSPAPATIIFLHGLGDQGRGWEPVARQLRQQAPHIKWILPTAPIRQVSLSGGYPMHSWFDIKSLKIGDEDAGGIKAAATTLNSLIQEEIAAGTASERIVIGGFSQGGATALYTSMTTEHKIGGTIALSTWLPLSSTINSISEDAKKSKYFMAHAIDDEVVLYEYGKASADKLSKLGIPEADDMGRGLDFNTYDDMGHSADPRELDDLVKWLQKVVPANSA